MATLIVSSERLRAGRNSYYNGKITIKGRGLVSVGSYCAIGDNLRIIAGNHHNYNYPAIQVSFYKSHFGGRYPGDIPCKGVNIGSDVWIGDNVTILDGADVGDGCCVAAGAVVVGKIPPYSIVGGVPAKILKSRFPQEMVDFMVNLAFWEWDEERVRRNRDFFHTDLSKLNAQQAQDMISD